MKNNLCHHPDMEELDLKLQEALRAESLDDIGKNGEAMLGASVADWAFEANVMQLMAPGQRLDPQHFDAGASLLFMKVTLWGSRETHILAKGLVPPAARKAVRPASAARKAVRPASAAGKAVRPASAAGKAIRPAFAASKAVRPASAARRAVRIMPPKAVKLLKQRKQQEAAGAAGSSTAAEPRVGVREVSS